jgi:hypothetical protein
LKFIGRKSEPPPLPPQTVTDTRTDVLLTS